jgi:hypothetical protein
MEEYSSKVNKLELPVILSLCQYLAADAKSPSCPKATLIGVESCDLPKKKTLGLGLRYCYRQLPCLQCIILVLLRTQSHYSHPVQCTACEVQTVRIGRELAELGKCKLNGTAESPSPGVIAIRTDHFATLELLLALPPQGASVVMIWIKTIPTPKLAFVPSHSSGLELA